MEMGEVGFIERQFSSIKSLFLQLSLNQRKYKFLGITERSVH